MRLGCRVTASDLNPVAWFVLKCTLDYPQRFAGKKWPLPEFANWHDKELPVAKVEEKPAETPTPVDAAPAPAPAPATP